MKIRTFTIISVTLLLMLCSCTKISTTEDYNTTFNNGTVALHNGDYVSARESFLKIPEDNDNYIFSLAGWLVCKENADVEGNFVKINSALNKLVTKNKKAFAVNVMKAYVETDFDLFTVDETDKSITAVYKKDDIVIRKDIYTPEYLMKAKLIYLSSDEGEISYDVYNNEDNLLYTITLYDNENGKKYHVKDYVKAERFIRESGYDPYPNKQPEYDYNILDSGEVIIRLLGNNIETVLYYDSDGQLTKAEYSKGYSVFYEYDNTNTVSHIKTMYKDYVIEDEIWDNESGNYRHIKYDLSYDADNPWYIYEMKTLDTKTAYGGIIIEVYESIDGGLTVNNIYNYQQLTDESEFFYSIEKTARAPEIITNNPFNYKKPFSTHTKPEFTDYV